MGLFNHIQINTTGNKKRVVKNVAWAMFGKIVNMAGTLLVAILVARYLGPEQYGLMSYVISYVSIFTIISEFGLSNIEIRELSANPDEKEKILGTCFRLRLLFAGIAFVLIILSLFIFKTNWETSAFIIVYGLSLFPNVFLLVRNYFTSIIKNEYIVKSEIARTAIGAIIKVGLVLLNCSLTWFIIASTFDFVLVASGYLISYKKLIGTPKDWSYDSKRAFYFVKESFPLVLSGAAIIIYQRIDQVMIGNMVDKVSVGYFATADKFLNLILFLPTILTQTVVPLIISAKEKNEKGRYEKLCKQMVSIVVWISILMASAVSLLSYPLISLTFGEKYLAAIPILQILAWKTVGMALSASSGQIIIIEHLQKWAFVRNAIACMVCIGLNYVFIPKFGAVGSAWVSIITVLVASYLSNIFIPTYHKVMKIQTFALLLGWKELKYLKTFINKK